MKIEVGKRYKTRTGRIITIVSITEPQIKGRRALYPVTGTDGHNIYQWRADGYFTSFGMNDWDLISEATDEPDELLELCKQLIQEEPTQ